MKHQDLDELLETCIAFHGHLCMGQVLGVKIAVKGLALADPSTSKELIVIVENDRCIADAIQTVTGTRLGRRSFKFKDYGKMAATFLNTATQKAYRVRAAFEGRVDPDNEAAVRATLHLPEEQMVAWEEVKTRLNPQEMPGKPQRIVTCVVCGEKVFDGKDKETDAGPQCLSCLSESYYSRRVSR
ncbi:MAG: FmdE family protein [Fibrobacterota bacterium]